MSTPIDTVAVRAAINPDDLTIDTSIVGGATCEGNTLDNPAIQEHVNEHFEAVFTNWADGSIPDPYETDEDSVFIPNGFDGLGAERFADIRSAYCTAIRNAIEKVHGTDPCDHASDYTL